MQERYIFPAVFNFEERVIGVQFPDLPGCLPCGDSLEDALHNAKEALELHLYGLEEDGDEIPSPTPAWEVSTKTEFSDGDRSVVVLVEAWMVGIRDEQKSRAVKKTLTVPRWLAEAGDEAHVNYSSLLQSAIKNHLGLSHRK